MIPAAALAAVTTTELSTAATLYGSLKQLRVRMMNADSESLDKSFELHVQNVMEKLDSRLPSQHNERLKFCEVAMARHGIYDASFQQVILLCQNISPALGDCLKELRSAHARILAEFQQILTASVADSDYLENELSNARGENKEISDNCKKLQEVIDILDKEAESNKLAIIDLQQQLRNFKLEAAKTQDVLASTPYSAVKSLTPSKSFDTSPVKQSKRTAPSLNQGTVVSATRSVATKPEDWLQNFRSELQRAVDEGRCREMSLKTLRDFLEKLYESKEQANVRLSLGTGNTAVETMEMHLYSSLEKKYGLRSIAAEQAGMVLIAIDRFSADDNFCNVFHKIFRNEIEEDFWLVQKELIKSVRDLVMVQLMSRYPTKDQGTLAQMLDQKIVDGVLAEDEWTDMVNYLYNTTDSTAICLMLSKLAVEEMNSQGIVVSDEQASSSSNQPAVRLLAPNQGQSKGGTKHSLNARTDMSRRLGYNSPSIKAQQQQQQTQTRQGKPKLQLRLSFAAFQKCILDFQLKSRLQYLSTFRAAFERYDSDFDGVLSDAEMRGCCEFLQERTSWFNVETPATSDESFDGEAINRLLGVMDPRQTDRITFSTAAAVISRAASPC